MDGLSDRLGPQTYPVKPFPHIYHHAHDLAIGMITLQCLADGCEHDVQPELVDRGSALVSELIGPLAAVLVLGVFPFGTDAFLEEMVIGFEG